MPLLQLEQQQGQCHAFAAAEADDDAKAESNKEKFNKCYVGENSRKDGADEPKGWWDSLFGGSDDSKKPKKDDGSKGSEHTTP